MMYKYVFPNAVITRDLHSQRTLGVSE